MPFGEDRLTSHCGVGSAGQADKAIDKRLGDTHLGDGSEAS